MLCIASFNPCRSLSRGGFYHYDIDEDTGAQEDGGTGSVFWNNLAPVYENWPQGTVRPKEEADASRIAQSAIYWGLTDRRVILSNSKVSGSHALGQKEGAYEVAKTKQTLPKLEYT